MIMGAGVVVADVVVRVLPVSWIETGDVVDCVQSSDSQSINVASVASVEHLFVVLFSLSPPRL